MASRTTPYEIEQIRGYPSALQIYRIGASKFWQVRLFAERKYLRKSTRCENKQDAIEFAKEFYDSVKIAQRLDHDVHRDTFSACASKLMDRQTSMVNRGEREARLLSEDRKKLDKDILPYFGTKAVAGITTQMLDDYVDHITGDRKLSASTLNKHLVVIRKVLREAYRRGYIKSLPIFPSIKRKDNPRPYFTVDEITEVRNAAKELADEGISVRGVPLTLEIRDFIVFAVHVFVRLSDLKLLRHRDIQIKTYRDDEGKKVRYLSIVPPHSKTVARESSSWPSAVNVYERIVERNAANGLADQSDFVFFPQYENREYALATIQRQFKVVVEKAGLTEDRFGQVRTPYSLRHSALMYQFQLSANPDIFMMARNALTSVGQLERFYLSHAESAMKIRELLTLKTPQKSPSVRTS